MSDVANPDGSHSVTASYRLDTEIAESTFLVRPIDPLYGVLHRGSSPTVPIAVIDVTAADNPCSRWATSRSTPARRRPATSHRVQPDGAVPRHRAREPTCSSTTRPCSRRLGLGGRRRGRAGAGHRRCTAHAGVRRARATQASTSTSPAAPTSPCSNQPGARSASRSTTASRASRSGPSCRLPAGDAHRRARPRSTCPTEGVAHISVEAQDLFDGHFYTLEEDRPFTLALAATINPDGSIAIQLK